MQFSFSSDDIRDFLLLTSLQGSSPSTWETAGCPRNWHGPTFIPGIGTDERQSSKQKKDHARVYLSRDTALSASTSILLTISIMSFFCRLRYTNFMALHHMSHAYHQ